MRDVRDYKASIRDDTKTQGSGSPFNIKSDSLTLRNFDHGKVRTLLGQHTAATGARPLPRLRGQSPHAVDRRRVRGRTTKSQQTSSLRLSRPLRPCV